MRWRNGPVPRPKKNDDLRCLGIRQRIGEGRHLLPAVLNLFGDLGRSPELVLADVHESRSLLRTRSGGAMAMGASLVAKQNRPSHRISL